MEDSLASTLDFFSVPTLRSREWRRCRFPIDTKPRDRVTTAASRQHATSAMADTYQLSAERPHVSLSPSDEFASFDCLQTPITTFTELLNAARSVEIDASATKTSDATVKPDNSVIQRRLRNRVSCRKTRLKRKLNQHALEILARDRQNRHEYLTQLARELGVNGSSDVHDSDRSQQDELFREFASRSLHYALVDEEYGGWLDDDSDQVATEGTTEMKKTIEEAANPTTRRSKRLRRAHDKDVSTALRRDPAAPQTSLFDQWRPIVDGLQNVDLKLHRMKETNLGAGMFERHCHWKFVGVSSAKVVHDGEIAAVAVSGITCLRFHRQNLQDVKIVAVRREGNVPFDCDASVEA